MLSNYTTATFCMYVCMDYENYFRVELRDILSLNLGNIHSIIHKSASIAFLQDSISIISRNPPHTTIP